MSSLRARHLAFLRERLGRLQHPQADVLAFGDEAIDAALPREGLAQNCLHELAGRDGDEAAAGFAAMLLGRLAGESGNILWCGRAGDTRLPYAPGLARFGIATERLVMVRTRTATELLWAMEEGLRARCFAAVLGDGIGGDLTATRRLQLAAEAGGATAVMLVPHLAGRLSAATTRWRVMAIPADDPERPRWRVVLERSRGGGHGTWDMEWDHETLHLRVVSILAHGSLAAAQ